MSRLFKFKYTSLISISLSSLLLSNPCPRLPDRAGGRCRSCRSLPAAAAARRAGAQPGAGIRHAGTGVHRAGACAGVRCVRALVAGVVLSGLVLESAFDDPGLVATAAALNPLDVLVIGGQDACALMLSSKGIEIEFMVRAFRCDYILLSSNQQNIHLKCITVTVTVYVDPSTKPMKIVHLS